jgi:hypothetical protein
MGFVNHYFSAVKDKVSGPFLASGVIWDMAALAALEPAARQGWKIKERQEEKWKQMSY